jgi:hypothetical protein
MLQVQTTALEHTTRRNTLQVQSVQVTVVFLLAAMYKTQLHHISYSRTYPHLERGLPVQRVTEGKIMVINNSDVRISVFLDFVHRPEF